MSTKQDDKDGSDAVPAKSEPLSAKVVPMDVGVDAADARKQTIDLEAAVID